LSSSGSVSRMAFLLRRQLATGQARASPRLKYNSL